MMYLVVIWHTCTWYDEICVLFDWQVCRLLLVLEWMICGVCVYYTCLWYDEICVVWLAGLSAAAGIGVDDLRRLCILYMYMIWWDMCCLIGRSVGCCWYWSGWSAASVYTAAIVCKGLGSRLPTSQYKGHTVLDRGPVTSAATATGRGTTDHAYWRGAATDGNGLYVTLSHDRWVICYPEPRQMGMGCMYPELWHITRHRQYS